jgi:hypothetical protein
MYDPSHVLSFIMCEARTGNVKGISRDEGVPRMIEFTCVHCGIDITVDDKFAGIQGTCENCRKIVTAPGGQGIESKTKTTSARTHMFTQLNAMGSKKLQMGSVAFGKPVNVFTVWLGLAIVFAVTVGIVWVAIRYEESRAAAVNLGVSRSNVRNALESSFKITYKERQPVFGQPNMVGISKDGLCRIQMVGPPDDLISVTMTMTSDETPVSKVIPDLWIQVFTGRLAPWSLKWTGEILYKDIYKDVPHKDLELGLTTSNGFDEVILTRTVNKNGYDTTVTLRCLQ